jgi:hypothetical protein
MIEHIEDSKFLDNPKRLFQYFYIETKNSCIFFPETLNDYFNKLTLIYKRNSRGGANNFVCQKLIYEFNIQQEIKMQGEV